MASNLDIKRKEIELLRVETARKELEFKIEERMDEVSRLNGHIEIQLQKENDLKEEIRKMRE